MTSHSNSFPRSVLSTFKIGSKLRSLFSCLCASASAEQDPEGRRQDPSGGAGPDEGRRAGPGPGAAAPEKAKTDRGSSASETTKVHDPVCRESSRREADDQFLTPVNQQLAEFQIKSTTGEINDDIGSKGHGSSETTERPKTLKSDECSNSRHSKKTPEAYSSGPDEGSSPRSDKEKSPLKTGSQKSPNRLWSLFSRKATENPSVEGEGERQESVKQPETAGHHRPPVASGQTSNGIVDRKDVQQEPPIEEVGVSCESDSLRRRSPESTLEESSAEENKLLERRREENVSPETRRDFNLFRDPAALRRVQSDNGGTESPSHEEADVVTMPKKKTFVDSTFYADPEGKYPTLEEQVSLAKTVAQSVMLPQNVESRGHRMFVRMRQRARAWTIGATQEELVAALAELDLSHADTIRFYQENPWAARLKHGGGQQHLQDEGGRDVPLPPLTVHSSALFAPNLKASMTPEQIDALSADEYERVVVLQEAEKLQVKPSSSSSSSKQQPVCFRFSDDLRQMKGKGARLFAARQAKAESWATSDGSSPSGPGAEDRVVVVPSSEDQDSEKNLTREDKVRFTPHTTTTTVFTTEDQSPGAEPGSPVILKLPPNTLPKSAGVHVDKDRRTIITISFPPSSSSASASSSCTGIVETTSTETEEKKSLSVADATCQDGLDSAELIALLGRSGEEPSTVPVAEEQQHPSEESKQQLPPGDTEIQCEETVTSRLPEAEALDEAPLFSSSAAHSTEGPIIIDTERPVQETPKHSVNTEETV